MDSCERHYPTRNGIAVPVEEIWLPPTHVNIEQKENVNNHHLEFTARYFGQCALLNMVRCCAVNQRMIPIDQHNYIHRNYGVHIIPSPKQAINFIEEQYYKGGNIKFKLNGCYTVRPIDEILWQQAISRYNEIKKNS